MIPAANGNTIVDAGAKPLPAQAVIPIPQGDKIIVKQSEASIMQGAIFIPDNKQERPYTGVVIKVGPGGRNAQGVRLPVDFEPGDTVMFSRYSGYDIEIEGESHKIMSELDVHCRMPREGEPDYEKFQEYLASETTKLRQQKYLKEQTDNMPGRFGAAAGGKPSSIIKP